MKSLILGTAGHIDHGKTSLVRELTGTDTDRLPQEKQRGMTIDIGFAQLQLGELQVGVIDVPGHERFIKNMLAGAAAIDVALLVVAADDSVMPQTREHLAILDLLGIERGVVAITKCDLRDDEWLELVEDDIRELLAQSRLADAPLIRTAVPAHGSAAGIDELRKALLRICQDVAPAPRNELFRLCVDRSFTVQGRGTVITGTVASGNASVGDKLDWLPKGEQVTVRELENHGQLVDEVGRGQRAAINLAGVQRTDIQRGHLLVEPGYLRSTQRLTVEISALATSPWPIKHRGRYRVHLGTLATSAELYLFAGQTIDPAATGLAQLSLAEPTAALFGQPFVVRMESPLETIGGGRVLQPCPQPIRRRQADHIGRIAELQANDERTIIAAAIWFYGWDMWTIRDLVRDTARDAAFLENEVAEMQQAGTVEQLAADDRHVWQLHADQLRRLSGRVVQLLADLHDASPLDPHFPRREVERQLMTAVDPLLTSAVVNRLLAERQLDGDQTHVALPGKAPQLTSKQADWVEQILDHFATATQPLPAAELATQLQAPESTVRELLQMCVAQQRLIHIRDDFHVDPGMEQRWREQIRASASSDVGLTVSEIRDILSTSRKYAIPLCEYWDRQGFTRRAGDVRFVSES